MKYLLISALTLLSFVSRSQISLSYSRALGMFAPSPLIAVTDSGYLSLKKEDASDKGKSWNKSKHKITLLKYSKDYKLIREVKLSGGANAYNFFYSELKKIGSKYWFIYLEPGEDEEMGDIKAVEVNPVTLELSQPKVVASKTSIDHKINMLVKVYELLFTIKPSPSEKYFSLFIRLTPKDCFISCLDQNLNPIWAKKERTEGLEVEGIVSTAISDAGNTYLGYVKKSVPGYSIYSLAGKLQTFTFNIEGSEAKEILFFPAKNSDVVNVCGTYKDDNLCSGVYNGVLKANGELGEVKKTIFPATVVEPLHKEGWANVKSRKYGIYPQFTTEQIRFEDGTYGFIGEFHTMGNPGEYFRSGSLLYVYFSKAGPVMLRAPKISIGVTYPDYVINGIHRFGSLYHAIIYKSKLILFYFDNSQNITRDVTLEAKDVTPGNQVIVAAVIAPDGSLQRQVVAATSLTYLGVTGIVPQAQTVPFPMIVNKAEALTMVKIEE